MKKILKTVVLVVIFGGTVFLLIAANQKVNQQSMKSPVIDLTVQDGISLLTEKELVNELYTLRLFRDGLKKNELTIHEIEAYLENMNEVLTADVYTDLDDQWHIDVKTRRPTATVIANGVDDFYIDNDFQLIRLSRYTKPKILECTRLARLISV